MIGVTVSWSSRQTITSCYIIFPIVRSSRLYIKIMSVVLYPSICVSHDCDLFLGHRCVGSVEIRVWYFSQSVMIQWGFLVVVCVCVCMCVCVCVCVCVGVCVCERERERESVCGYESQNLAFSFE